MFLARPSMESINRGWEGEFFTVVGLGQKWELLILVAQRVPASVQGARAGIWTELPGEGNIPGASPSTVPAGWAPPATF